MSNEQPLISIITATFNNAQALAGCLDSVAGQTSSDYEHIVIDGDSQDGTRTLLEQKSSERLQWISEPDEGIADAINKGIQLARGEWILVLHADDAFLHSTALEEFGKIAKDSGLIQSFPVALTSEHQPVRILSNRGFVWQTRFKTTIPHQGAFIHRTAYHIIGRYDTSFKIALDYDWFYRARNAGLSITTHRPALTLMSGAGISSQRDCLNLTKRFAEEKRVHLKNAPSRGWRFIYHLYWSIYPFHGLRKHRLS